MSEDNKKRVNAWIAQAKNDLAWAEHSFASDFFAQTCFICQQIAEKALKGLAYSKGVSQIKSHSVSKIAKALELNGEIADAAAVLDLYYTSGRYPDVLPDNNAPFEYFTSSQAKQALAYAQQIIAKVDSKR